MNTIKKVAVELGIQYCGLKRLLKLGRIPGVRKPKPRQWHYLTNDEVNIISKFVRRK